MSSKCPVQLGIAGLGRSGWFNHVLTLGAMPDLYQIAAVCDPNADRCQEVHDKYGARIYADFDGFIQDPEIETVVLATPNRLHYKQSIEALSVGGKNVIVEKPMADDDRQAALMIECAAKSEKILTVFQNQRYMPSFQKVKEVIASGKLGRIVKIRLNIHGFGRRWDWQTLKEFNGGELNNTGPHFLDQALDLFGPATPEVFCHMEPTLTLGDAEDYVLVILKHPEAPLVELEISKASAYPQSLWSVMGTRGGLTGSANELTWKYADFSKLASQTVEKTPTPDRSYNSETYDWTEETWTLPADLPSTQTLFYEDLFKTFRQGAPLVIAPAQIKRQMQLIQQCRLLSPSINS